MKDISEVRFAWKYFEYAFKGLCICLTMGMATWCGYNYYLDEDETIVSFHKFHHAENDIYPSVSICINFPFEQQKLDLYAKNVTAQKYFNFLSGSVWSDDLAKINFDSVVLHPFDYVLGYELLYRNTTRVMKTYTRSVRSQEKHTNMPLPTIRFIMANMICFGISILSGQNMYAMNIKIKTEIFKDGVRPSYMDFLTIDRGIAVVFHYPKQISRSNWWTNHWPTRHANDSKNYIMSFNVRGLEVVRFRNKRSQVCEEGFPDYDDETMKDIFKSVGCRPPFAKSMQNIARCKNSKQMKEISRRQIKLWEDDNLLHLPCRGIERLNTDFTELDEEETNDPYFTISLNAKDNTYKEIRMKRAYDIWILVGNVGGFIGLFLGYSLMMFPELLRIIILRFRMRSINEQMHIHKNTTGGYGDRNEINHKLAHLSTMISHLQNEVTSMQKRLSQNT